MNPLEYWEGHFCYRGENFDGKYIYDFNLNKIDGETYLSGQKVYPGTLKESLPDIYYDEDKTYIFPGDVFCKTILDKDNNLIYELVNVKAELGENGEYILVNNNGKKVEELTRYKDDEDVKIIYSKEIDE